MFLYVELDKIPFMVLHQSCDPLNRSIEESKTHETKEKAKSNL